MYMYVCVQMHTCLGLGGRCLQRPEAGAGCFPNCHSSGLLRQNPSVSLELTNSNRLGSL